MFINYPHHQKKNSEFPFYKEIHKFIKSEEYLYWIKVCYQMEKFRKMEKTCWKLQEELYIYTCTYMYIWKRPKQHIKHSNDSDHYELNPEVQYN